MITLEQILDLVGTLDDTPGENTARERFRKFLNESVRTIGAVRDYVETCLRTAGPQYSRALQDLVNHAARRIQFEVQFGRYQGVTNEIGYDGVWRSKELDIVVEVKTTDIYAIKTATLSSYVDHLISEKRLESWDRTLGLYLVGRPDAELKQLENAIVAEKRTHQLRVATIETMLLLGELVESGLITHDEVVTLLRPVGVSVDDTVRLLARVAGTAPEIEPTADLIGAPMQNAVKEEIISVAKGAERHYLLTPVADDETASAEDIIRRLLDSGWYVFGERTAGRKLLKPGDHICFFRSGVGVVAEAEVATEPERKTIPHVKHPEKFPWAFKVRKVRYFFEKPLVIDAALRAKLDAFKKSGAEAPWGWFVVTTRVVSEHDFVLLAGRQERKTNVASAAV